MAYYKVTMYLPYHCTFFASLCYAFSYRLYSHLPVPPRFSFTVEATVSHRLGLLYLFYIKTLFWYDDWYIFSMPIKNIVNFVLRSSVTSLPKTKCSHDIAASEYLVINTCQRDIWIWCDARGSRHTIYWVSSLVLTAPCQCVITRHAKLLISE